MEKIKPYLKLGLAIALGIGLAINSFRLLKTVAINIKELIFDFDPMNLGILVITILFWSIYIFGITFFWKKGLEEMK